MKNLTVKIFLTLIMFLIATKEGKGKAKEWNDYWQELTDRKWTQYIELLQSLNYGTIELDVNHQPRDESPIHYLTGAGIGYGVKTGILSIGARAQVQFMDGFFSENYIQNLTGGENSHGGPTAMAIDGEFEIVNKATYSLLFMVGLDLITYKKYRAGLIGGLGLAVHHVNTRDEFDYYLNLDNTPNPDPFVSSKSAKTNFIPKLAIAVGLQQEYFVSNNVAVGLELKYLHLGSVTYNFKDACFRANGTVQCDRIKMENITLRSNGMLNANFTLRVYL